MKNFLILIISIFLFQTGYSQQAFRKFATQKVHKRLMKEYPELIRVQNEIDFLSRKKNHKIKQKVTLPLVFHVLHSNPVEQISEEQIISQIQALNRDFTDKGPKDEHLALNKEGFGEIIAGDTNIEFCLASEDPIGKKTSGINYFNVSKTNWSTDDEMKEEMTEGVSPWDPSRYINIWICGLDDNISGYAQMPWGPQSTDGIVIDYRFVGTMGIVKAPYDQGKTLTHLMGNYLGLYDLWSEGNKCVDDYVKDTPIHNTPNYRCPEYKHISLCEGLPVEMTMNFMDNTNDACMYMFTKGQLSRMHAILAEGGARFSLTEARVKCKKNPQIQEQPDDISDQSFTPVNVNLLEIFPNPVNDEMTLKLDSKSEVQSSLRIFDSTGRLIYQWEWNVVNGTQSHQINCETWPNGLYLIQIDLRDEVISERVLLTN